MQAGTSKFLASFLRAEKGGVWKIFWCRPIPLCFLPFGVYRMAVKAAEKGQGCE